MKDDSAVTLQPLQLTLESALYADDLDAATRFYGGILGLPDAGRVAGRHAFFRVGASVLLIFRAAATQTPGKGGLPVPPHGARGPGHFCFAVTEEALDGWRAQLEQHGIVIEADFRWPGGARSLYFRDPAGNSIEMADPRLWG